MAALVGNAINRTDQDKGRLLSGFLERSLNFRYLQSISFNYRVTFLDFVEKGFAQQIRRRDQGCDGNCSSSFASGLSWSLFLLSCGFDLLGFFAFTTSSLSFGLSSYWLLFR